MLKKIYDMPAGTLGFEAVGEVDDDDVEKVLVPALRRWIAERGKVRLLYVLGSRLEEFEGDAVSENAKFLARHPTAFERVAVVSDEGWLAPAIKALSLLLPGRPRRLESVSCPMPRGGWRMVSTGTALPALPEQTVRHG